MASKHVHIQQLAEFSNISSQEVETSLLEALFNKPWDKVTLASPSIKPLRELWQPYYPPHKYCQSIQADSQQGKIQWKLNHHLSIPHD